MKKISIKYRVKNAMSALTGKPTDNEKRYLRELKKKEVRIKELSESETQAWDLLVKEQTINQRLADIIEYKLTPLKETD